MSAKMTIDSELLAEIRQRKERQRRELNLPIPTAAEMQQRFLHDLLKSVLNCALNSLPNERRELVQRHILDGEAEVDIARDLGISRSTVYRRNSKSLLQLRRLLQQNPIVQAILLADVD
jgi:DNA-directed RNA polymerase specialized sigma24 family protein